MANFITIFRIFLVFIAIYLIPGGNLQAFIWAFVLIAVAFALDGVDGWVARKFNESSKLGAVLDIMSDRIVENTLWVAFTAFGWLPMIFPIIALTRSFVVDSIRSVAMEQGLTAFGETSMQKDKIGNWICSSKFSRITYAVAKVLAFIIILAAKTPGLDPYIAKITYMTGYFTALIAIEFCILRGLPVIFESKQFFVKEKNEKI